jgi:hypothetical protein
VFLIWPLGCAYEVSYDQKGGVGEKPACSMRQAESGCWFVHDRFLIVSIIDPKNEGDLFLGDVCLTSSVQFTNQRIIFTRPFCLSAASIYAAKFAFLSNISNNISVLERSTGKKKVKLCL